MLALTSVLTSLLGERKRIWARQSRPWASVVLFCTVDDDTRPVKTSRNYFVQVARAFSSRGPLSGWSRRWAPMSSRWHRYRFREA